MAIKEGFVATIAFINGEKYELGTYKNFYIFAQLSGTVSNHAIVYSAESFTGRRWVTAGSFEGILTAIDEGRTGGVITAKGE